MSEWEQGYLEGFEQAFQLVTAYLLESKDSQVDLLINRLKTELTIRRYEYVK
jgi:hypothetical protein